MKVLLAVSLAALLCPSLPAMASPDFGLQVAPSNSVLERRSHHCPKGAVVISSRCRGV